MARVRKVTKLLLVEDNAMGRKMLVRRLTRKGFEVVVAADGAEAPNHLAHLDAMGRLSPTA